MKKYFRFILVSLIFLCGCASPSYIGKSYSPTSSVDIYYSAHDVKKDYEVIGKVNNKGTNLQKIQNGIVNEAKKRGADGVIYSNLQSSSNVVNGNSSSYKELNADFIKYK